MVSNVGPPDLFSAGGVPTSLMQAPQDHATAEVFRLSKTIKRFLNNVVQLRTKNENSSVTCYTAIACKIKIPELIPTSTSHSSLAWRYIYEPAHTRD